MSDEKKAEKPETPEKSESTKPAEPSDDVVSTHHELKVRRTSLAYTATTGRVVLREEVYEDGVFRGHRAKAEIFMTSYVADDAGSERPVMFAFNGGPGSSSIWLHLGLLGPRRVVMGDAGKLLPPPYALTDNAESLLAVCDLVFIDPVATGYSRAAEGEKPAPFLGYQGDIDSVGELIRLWTSRQNRWLSPKFVAGESYGTLRGAALVEHLQSKFGMYVNGLVLVSSVLDLSSIDFDKQHNDRAHALYLPTYAAIAQYHGRLGRTSLRKAVADAEAYVPQYRGVLAQGTLLSAKDRAAAVKRIAALTGLTADYVDRADLRIEHWRFFGELLRDQRLAVGRIDGRFTGPAASAIAENMDADPSMDAITGPYATAFNHYVHSELGYHNDLPYEVLSGKANEAWSYKDFEGRPIDVTPKLERAMRMNQHLKVHVAYGYFDGATPHHAAEDVIAHLNLTDAQRAQIEHHYYEAGHMMYVHEPTRLKQSNDIADFVRRASGGNG